MGTLFTRIPTKDDEFDPVKEEPLMAKVDLSNLGCIAPID